MILTVWPRGKSGRIQLVRVNVADRDVRGVTEGLEEVPLDAVASISHEEAIERVIDGVLGKTSGDDR